VTAVWLATGVFNIFPVSLVVPLAHYTGVERMRFSVNGATFIGILVAASLSAFVNAGSYQVIVAKSPTFWATCSQMAIPLSMILDYCLHGLVPTVGQCGGYCLLIASFLILAELLPFQRPSEPLLEEGTQDTHELSPVSKGKLPLPASARDLARCGA